MRKTKIVATIGPASSNPEMLTALIQAGVDVFRLNFSHGTHEAHGAAIDRIRELADAAQRPIAILADLQGPKIRIGRLAEGAVQVTNGQTVRIRFVAEDAPPPEDPGLLPTIYPHLAKDLRPGDPVLIDDGNLVLEAVSTDGETAVLRVIHGGTIKDHKGINLPGVKVSAPSLTEKDEEDLAYAASRGVDYLALSFVRSPTDLMLLRSRLEKLGRRIPIIAKVEKPDAVEHLTGIIAEADGIMVARGDLGVEMGPEEVPLIQKRMIRECIQAGKPVITATQMLESMTQHPRPTRAEASDVANAILDGTDAIMLSAETASGQFPLAAVQTMDRIARRMETMLPGASTETDRYAAGQSPPRDAVYQGEDRFAQATVNAAAAGARALSAKAIVVFTISGRTACQIARVRPRTPIYAFTPDPTTFRRLSLVWGVTPLHLAHAENTDELVVRAEAFLVARKIVEPGDALVMISGTTTLQGATNLVKLHRVGGGLETIVHPRNTN